MGDYIAVFCVFLSSLLGASGSYFFKQASGKLSISIRLLIQNGTLIMGFVLFGMSSLVYLFGLNLSQLTVIYPISSLSYVWSLFIGRYLLNEKVTKLKVTGILLIIAGNILVVASI